MKFYVHRTPTVMSGLVVRWNPAANLNAEVSASRDAVCITGFWELSSPTDIAMFRTVLAQAEEARHLIARGRHHEPPRYENEVELDPQRSRTKSAAAEQLA